MGAVRFIPLGHLPGPNAATFATDVSADGSVVVGTAGPIDDQQGRQAFRWTRGGGMVGLGDVPGGWFYSEGHAVSADGTTVVGHATPGNAVAIAFRWTESTGLVGIGQTISSVSLGISGDGTTVVGYAYQDQLYAFRWTESGGFEFLPTQFRAEARDISYDGSVIVGQSRGEDAVRWTIAGGMQGLGDLPGGRSWGFANAVSADGSTIAGWSTSANGEEAFRWTANEGMVGLGDLPGGSFESRAYDVSSDGSTIVGTGWSDRTFEDAFIWTAATGMLSIYDVLTSEGVDLKGWHLRLASSISDDGNTIAGWGTNPSGQYEAFVVQLSVPEPATCVSLIIFAVVTLIGRRR